MATELTRLFFNLHTKNIRAQSFHRQEKQLIIQITTSVKCPMKNLAFHGVGESRHNVNTMLLIKN